MVEVLEALEAGASTVAKQVTYNAIVPTCSRLVLMTMHRNCQYPLRRRWTWRRLWRTQTATIKAKDPDYLVKFSNISSHSYIVDRSV